MPVRSDIKDKSDLDNLFNSHTNILIMFTASWCGPCKKIKPLFNNLSSKNLSLEFVEIDIDDSSDIGDFFEIKSVPTFIKFKNSQQVNKIIGGNAHELERIIYT